MPAGGERQAPGGGEVRVLQFGDDNADSGRPDGFLRRPERFTELAGGDVQNGRARPAERLKASLQDMPMLPHQAGLPDPGDGPLAGGASRQGKAGEGGEVSMRGLADLMHSAFSKAEWKDRKRPLHLGRETEKLCAGECQRTHLFIICSRAPESIAGASVCA